MGRPVPNAFIESFYGRFRKECLDEHDFNNRLLGAMTNVTPGKTLIAPVSGQAHPARPVVQWVSGCTIPT